ncbi:MAG: hypothetical protein AB7H71_17585, partial [Alphaproteobacteria bacterium]
MAVQRQFGRIITGHPSMRPISRIRCPGESVVSRQVVEDLGGGFVAEASQSGAIVVIDEGVDEGVALGVVG